jgi:transposase
MLVHRQMQTPPETFLHGMAPSRAGLGVAVACLFTWSWLADLCPHEGIPCGRGHALYMKASPGGQAKHATIDAQNIAVRRRGGLRPQASVDPAARRATRALLRRRLQLLRQRAEL